MKDLSHPDVRLEKLASDLADLDPDLSASLRWQLAGREGPADSMPKIAPEAWFDRVLRLPESARDAAITTLADQFELAFLPITMSLADEAPLPYHRVFALKRLPRFPTPEVRSLLERVHLEGRGPDYGPYFASVMNDIDPVWAKQVLESPSAVAPPRPRAPVTPEEEGWGSDSRGVWPTVAIVLLAVVGCVALIAGAAEPLINFIKRLL